jgi:hypothetical protein
MNLLPCWQQEITGWLIFRNAEWLISRSSLSWANMIYPPVSKGYLTCNPLSQDTFRTAFIRCCKFSVWAYASGPFESAISCPPSFQSPPPSFRLSFLLASPAEQMWLLVNVTGLERFQARCSPAEPQYLKVGWRREVGG